MHSKLHLPYPAAIPWVRHTHLCKCRQLARRGDLRARGWYGTPAPPSGQWREAQSPLAASWMSNLSYLHQVTCFQSPDHQRGSKIRTHRQQGKCCKDAPQALRNTVMLYNLITCTLQCQHGKQYFGLEQ